MQLIERYVNEVGRRLPKKQRQEVRRELRSALLDAVTAQTGDDGAPPTEQQVISVLEDFGPPEKVAASYRPADQYLIGPELFPHFKRVLAVVTTVLLFLLVGAFGFGLLVRSGNGVGLGGQLLGFVGALVDSVWLIFSIVVVIFALLQRLEVRPEADAVGWDPRRLPALDDDSDLAGRGEMAFSVVAAGIFLALLYVFKDAIGVVVHPDGELLLNDVLVRFLPWLSAALLAGMALHAYLFWRGRWERPTRIANLVIDLFGIGVLYRLAVAVAAERPRLEAAPLPAPVPTMIVQIAWTVFAVVLIVFLWENGRLVWRRLRRTSDAGPRAAERSAC